MSGVDCEVLFVQLMIHLASFEFISYLSLDFPKIPVSCIEDSAGQKQSGDRGMSEMTDGE